MIILLTWVESLNAVPNSDVADTDGVDVRMKYWTNFVMNEPEKKFPTAKAKAKAENEIHWTDHIICKKRKI